MKRTYHLVNDLPDVNAVKQRATVFSLLWVPDALDISDENVTKTGILDERQVTVLDFYRGRPATATPPGDLGGN